MRCWMLRKARFSPTFSLLLTPLLRRTVLSSKHPALLLEGCAFRVNPPPRLRRLLRRPARPVEKPMLNEKSLELPGCFFPLPFALHSQLRIMHVNQPLFATEITMVREEVANAGSSIHFFPSVRTSADSIRRSDDTRQAPTDDV